MKFIKNFLKSINKRKKEINISNKVFHIYDDQQNLVYYCDTDREFECFKDYDDNGNEIHHKDSNEFEYWKDYDNNGNIIHYKDNTGHEYWDLYDDSGKLISHMTTK